MLLCNRGGTPEIEGKEALCGRVRGERVRAGNKRDTSLQGYLLNSCYLYRKSNEYAPFHSLTSIHAENKMASSRADDNAQRAKNTILRNGWNGSLILVDLSSLVRSV